MKKIFVFLVLAAAVLAACIKEQPDGPVVKTVLTIGSQPTKTTLGAETGNSRQLYWANGDKVAANGVTSLALSGLTANTETRAAFSFTETVTAPYNVVYPASIYKDENTVILPHNAGDQVIPLAGVSQTSSFNLAPLTSILQLKIKQAASNPDTDHIVLIEVSTASTRMSGEFGISYTDGTLTAVAPPTGNDLAVQITGDWTLSATASSFFIPVPEGTYGFTVKVVDKKGHFMTMSTTTDKVFTRGEIKPLTEFAFTPGANEGGLQIDTPEKLIAFAQAYNSGDYGTVGKDLMVSLTADLSFNASTSAAFNATGGIGAGGNDDPMFNGVFDGGNHTISGLEATVPVFARVGQYGTVKNLSLGATSSLNHSAAISSNTYLGAIAGYCKGNITDCTNNAAVTCSSTTRSAGVIYLGGIVARQNGSGTISGCVNNAAVTCTTSNGTGNIYMGGIVGSVERPAAANTANIQNCTNTGVVKNGLDSGEPPQSCILHMGGVVGWINSTASSAKMTVTGLVNKGNVTKTQNSEKKNGIPVLVGGIVGGIHGTAISDACGEVSFVDSHVAECSISNGDFNNTLSNTAASTDYSVGPHVGGFVGVARGDTDELSFNDGCFVKNVAVSAYRGYAGGFASWIKGATLDGCKVLGSSVKASAVLRIGGGIAGHMRSVKLTDCVVTLTKDSSSSLYGKVSQSTDFLILGGIAGSVEETNTIDRCKVYVDLMYAETASSPIYGWIIGAINGGTTTVKDCGLNGTYGKSTASFSLDNDSGSSHYFANHICGSGTPTLSGTNYYWGDPVIGQQTVTVNIGSYASAHGWGDPSTSNYQSTVEQGGVTLTASADEGSNGAYCPDWRFYQARGGGLTITVPAGYSLISAQFTYTNKNDGAMIAPDGSTTVSSGSEYSLSGSSAMFTVGGSNNQGQARISEIIIKFE